jgi:hypothetical protein
MAMTDSGMAICDMWCILVTTLLAEGEMPFHGNFCRISHCPVVSLS